MRCKRYDWKVEKNKFLKKRGCLVAVEIGPPAPFATSDIIGRENKRTNNKTMLLS